MRTKGPMWYKTGNYRVYKADTPDTVGQFDSPDTAQHWLECHEAIEAIGGEPETVKQLADLVKRFALCDRHDYDFAVLPLHEESIALLAKLPEPKK